MKTRSVVKRLLGEAPVDPQSVGNPGEPPAQPTAGFSTVFKAVKLEDFEPSDELDAYLGEASGDGATYEIEGLEWLANGGGYEPLRAEIAKLVAAMKAANANLLILV